MKSPLWRSTGLRLIAALSLCFTGEAQTSGIFFPKGTNLTSIVSLSDNSLGSPEQQIMIATLQGIVARSSTRQLYIDSSTYSRWRLHLANTLKIPSTIQSDPWALLTQFKGYVSGYVLYDYANSNSRNAATSLCGPLNAIAVDLKLETLVRARGITNRLADIRAENEAAIFANFPGRFNRKIVVEQLESFTTQLRDYAVMADAFTFADGNTPFRASVLASLETDAARLGWGQGSENTHIGTASDAGVFTVPSDHARNLSTLSSVRTSPALQRTHHLPMPETNVHYVAFLVTDGDNLQWTLGDFPDYFNHPLRGSFNMGWALPPALADLAPSALQWFFEKASNGVAKDFFVAGPSALGYMYPSRYPRADLERHTRRFNDFAAVSDLRIAQIIDFNSFNRLDLWSRYTTEPNIDALIYVEYSRYDARGGAVQWQNGKPIVSPRKMLWSGINGADEASVITALNGAARDPGNATGYSLVMVHVWSKTLANVRTVVNGLAAQVRVVTPGELVRLMTMNIAGQHAFDYQNGLQGWSGSTSGKVADHADWMNGTLRLTGSDAVTDTTPNATFTRPVSLPWNTIRLRYDTRAAGGAVLRVRLRRANGGFVTLADWSSLSDSNWQPVVLNLMPYAGEDVTLYFEQNCNGINAIEERYLDNVVLEKEGTLNVFEAEADANVTDGEFSSKNFGSSLVLSVGKGTNIQEAYVRFPLTNVSGRVLDARLRLTPRMLSGSATHGLSVVADNGWGEATLTWDNRPASNDALTNWVAAQGIPVELSVIDAVQNALTNGGSVSFRVFAQDAASVAYASREDHALYAPRLIIITSNAPPIISNPRLESDTFTFSWSANSSWNLYRAPTLESNWTRVIVVPTTANGQTTFRSSITERSAFYQLRQP
jgi:hypothetical protein